MNAPRWLFPVCLIVAVFGALLAFVGPIAIYGVARWSATSRLTPEQRQNPEVVKQAVEETIEPWRSRVAIILPVGMGLAFAGGMATLFAWFTLPEMQPRRPVEEPPSDAASPAPETDA